MNQEKNKITVGKIFKFIVIVLVAFIVCGTVFFVFKVTSDGNKVLREAKNVRMSLRSADIEMYAIGKTVFNPSKKNGIEDGVKSKVEKLYKPEGVYAITSYKTSKHEITGFTYKRDHYIVTFSKDGDEITWDVDYIFNLYHYDENDDI